MNNNYASSLPPLEGERNPPTNLDLSTNSSPCISSFAIEEPSKKSSSRRTEGSLLPSSQGCREAIDLFNGEAWDGSYGAVPQLSVSPRSVGLSAKNLSGRTVSGALEQREEYPGRGRSKEITRRSLNQMVKTWMAIDFSPFCEEGAKRAFVTLTYPEDWTTVAPNGEVVAKHLEKFLRKLEAAFGQPLVLLWKREFAERGAPHLHIFLLVPEGTAGESTRRAYERRFSEWEAEGRTGNRPRWRKPALYRASFEHWARKAWPTIVNHPDPLQRAKHELHGVDVKFSDDNEESEIRTIIAYFSKPSKSYQHRVPELWKQSDKSIGGTWGRRGLKTVKEHVQLSQEEFHLLSRVLRRGKRTVRRYDSITGKYIVSPAVKKVLRPRGRIIGEERDEYGQLQPVQKLRKTTVRRSTTSHTGAGYMITDNGPRFAAELYRYLLMATAPTTPRENLPVGMRGSIQDRPTRRAISSEPITGVLQAV